MQLIDGPPLSEVICRARREAELDQPPASNSAEAGGPVAAVGDALAATVVADLRNPLFEERAALADTHPAAARRASGRAEDLRTHGAALFRAGRFDEAAKRLEEALAARPAFPSAWLLLAMTERGRGRSAEAVAWAAKAAERIAREPQAGEGNWQERVELDVLFREAEQTAGAAKR